MQREVRFKIVLIVAIVSAISAIAGSNAMAAEALGGVTSADSVNDATLRATQSNPPTVISSSGITSNTGANTPNRGIIINSNPDATAGEFFQIQDGGVTVFTATGGTSTKMQSGTSSVTVNNNGTVGIVTTGGASITGGGLNMNAGGITNAGAISGATTINASGTITGGNLSTGGTLGVTGLSTLSGGASISGGLNNNSGGVTNAGAVSGVTTLSTSGLATLDSASITNNATVGGTLGVTGATTTAGITNTGVLSSTGATTLTGATNINTAGAAATTIGNTTAATTVNVRGGTGALSVANNLTTLSVTSGASVIGAGTTTGEMAIVNLGQAGRHATIGSDGTITMTSAAATESTASLTLTNGLGNTHGIAITERQTVLSGGTRTTALTLNDTGATFSTDGRPARVTGVADGSSDFDAVNFRQLKRLVNETETKLSRGTAGVAALGGIPQVDTNKTVSLGGGVGVYNGQAAWAVGASVRLAKNAVIKAGVSFSNSSDSITSGIGMAFSW